MNNAITFILLRLPINRGKMRTLRTIVTDAMREAGKTPTPYWVASDGDGYISTYEPVTEAQFSAIEQAVANAVDAKWGSTQVGPHEWDVAAAWEVYED